MTTYWCEHVQLPGRVRPAIRLTVEDGRFTAVEERRRPAEGDVLLMGVVLPGFADGHGHAFHRAMRGTTHSGGGTFWTWREKMYAVAGRLTPDTYLDLARAVFLEMALAGYTLAGDFHYLHHDAGGATYVDPNAMGRAVIQAASEVGIRLTLLDTLYLAGGLDGEGHAPLDPVQQRFSDGSVQAWAARVADLDDDDLTRIGLAVHSVRSVSREALGEVAQVCAGRVVHAHISEQIAENVAAQAFYGLTPTGLVADAGLLTDRFTAVHATHLTDDDMRLIADAGATACFCPSTERDLADGVGPAGPLRDLGVRMSLGSDQHAVIDPFDEARSIEMHERLRTHERGCFTPSELVAMGSGHGYRSLGWDDGGRIEVGALADFVVVDRESRRTAGARPDQLVYAASSADVTDVVVAGRRIVADREHALGDSGWLMLEALEALRAQGDPA